MIQAQSGHVLQAMGLFGVNVIWTLLYDTQYAMADYQDDLELPIHTMPKWLGSYIMLFLKVAMVILLGIAWWVAWWGSSISFWMALVFTHIIFYWQLKMLYSKPWLTSGVRTFLSHNYLGGVWCLALWYSY